MPRQRHRSIERVVTIDGRLFLFRGDEMAFEIPKGKNFAGSKVHTSGRWANCNKCGKRIAVGAQCTCGKQLREVRAQRKPDDIKGT